MKVPVRERYNAKARGSTVGGSSHKNKRSFRQREADEFDSNAQIIAPGSEQDVARKEAERKRRELLAASGQDGTAPISAKKRKRLDAYIASRLKKEERVKIMASLAQSSSEIDRTTLRSAATLGTGRAKTMEERIETANQKLGRGTSKRRRRGNMNGAIMQIHEDDDDADLDREDKQGAEALSATHTDDDDERKFTPPEDLSGDDDGPVGEVEEDPERRARILAAASLFNTASGSTSTTNSSTTIGSALARGPDGQPLAPKTRKRTKKATRAPGSGTSWGRLTAAQRLNQDAGDSDSSFDSSASEAEGDTMGPAPIASLSRKNNNMHNLKGKGKATEEPEEDVEEATGMAHRDEGSDDDDASSGSEEPDTDDDEEAVFLEAMRLRGLLPPGSPQTLASRSLPTGESTQEQDVGTTSASTDGTVSSEEDAASAEDQQKNDGEDDEEGSDGDQESDEEPLEADEESAYRSRRRGIGQSARSSGFKNWARAAVGLAPGNKSNKDGDQEVQFIDEDTAYNLEPVGGYKVKVGDLMPDDGFARGPLGRDDEGAPNGSPFALKHYAELRDAVTAKDKADTVGAVTHVDVQRSEDSTVARLRLPVVAEEDTIVRTIMENPVTVICGETGSGKTTQVPQFLYEAAFGNKSSLNPGMIGVTQPRRVAAVSMAQRVGTELRLASDKVSYQIRYDATVSPETAIKFMTDGVLLRELATDFLLSKYSAIMVDEAHERSINTDVLIGVLSRVVRLREKRWLEGEPNARPLRLVIMSATLRVADFTENKTLFPLPPPVINIDARQHPVTVHFNRKTVQDYITESVKKATKIHARLPPGGILIFLTGQQEITSVCKKLEQRFGRRAIAQKRRDRERVANKFEYSKRHARANKDLDDSGSTEQVHINARIGDVEAEEIDLGASQDLAADVDDGMDAENDPDALDTDDDEGSQPDDDLPDELKDDTDVPMHILPLYSLLPSDKQMRIFEDPPVDSRLVVVATNVAETSLTIPNIRYVIDCGRSKERKYNLLSGVQSYEVCWVSKASASQRAGRAGRTGPGHCYRLYSSAVYEDHLPQFSSPEILRTPVEGLVLSMKAMNIDNVANFPFPTPPDRLALKKAEQILTYLGALAAPAVASVALSETKKRLNHAQITELGRTMTLFPVSPRYAKMLAQGQQHGCLPYIVAMVAALSIGDPFVREQLLEEEYGTRRAAAAASTPADGGEAQDDYDRAFGAMEGDEDLGSELAHVNNKELLDRERRKARRSKYFATMRKFEALGVGLSDTFRLLSVVGAYEYEGGSTSFCDQNFVRPKAMEEIHKLRAQLCSLISSTFPNYGSSLSSPKLKPPTETQLKVIRQLIAAAYIDQVAVRADLIGNESVTSSSLVHPDERTSEMLFKLKNAGGGDRMQSTRGVPYKAMGVPGFAFIHPTSSFYHATPPSWLVFGEVQQSAGKYAKTGDDDADSSAAVRNTIWLKLVTKINPVWLSTLGRTLCTFSKPTPVVGSGAGGGSSAELASSIQAMKAGQQSVGQTSRSVLVTPTYAVGSETDGLAGGLGWELPSIKATQTLVKGRWILQL